MTRSFINKFSFLAVALVFALALPVPALAAPMTLSEAVGMAVSRNATLQAAKEKFNQYRYQASGTWSALLPNISLDASSTYRKDSVANKSVGSVPFGGEPYNLYNLSLKGKQPLFSWGSFSAVREAGYDRDIQQTELEITERTVMKDVISSFYQVVVNEKKVDILLDQQKVVEDALSMAKTRYRLAGGRKLDVLQMRTQLALLKPKIETARIDLATSAAALANLLGEQEKPDIQLRNDLPSLKGKIGQAAGGNLPELEKIRLNREKIDAEKSVALGRHLPELSLNGDYSFLNYTKADLLEPSSNSWSVQVLLTVPLFSGLSSIYERRALNSQETQLDFEETNLRNDLNLQQIKSRKAMEAAEASLVSAEEAADLARQSMVQGRSDFRLGIIDFLQYLQVQQSQLEAYLSLNQLKYDNIVAYANYYIASGRPLNELVQLLSARPE
jgi:outer membrane protein